MKRTLPVQICFFDFFSDYIFRSTQCMIFKGPGFVDFWQVKKGHVTNTVHNFVQIFESSRTSLKIASMWLHSLGGALHFFCQTQNLLGRTIIYPSWRNICLVLGVEPPTMFQSEEDLGLEYCHLGQSQRCGRRAVECQSRPVSSGQVVEGGTRGVGMCGLCCVRGCGV